MAPEPYYDKVSEDDSAIDLDQPSTKPAPSRWSWGRQSLFVRTLLVVAYTIIIAALCSFFIDSRAPASTASTATTTLSKPQAAAEIDAAIEPTFTPSVVASVEPTPNPSAVTSVEPTSTSSAVASPTSNAKITEIQGCGGNAAEARALGCVYDVMMQLWMPEACYDSPLTEKFLAEGNWTWWADPEAQHEMSDEEMRKGEHSVAYMLQDYHKHHCVFAMEKLVRALRTEAPLIPELVSYDHIVHCRHKTLMRTDIVRGVRAPTGFTRCASYETWVAGNLPSDAHSSTGVD